MKTEDGTAAASPIFDLADCEVRFGQLMGLIAGHRDGRVQRQYSGTAGRIENAQVAAQSYPYPQACPACA